MVRLKADTTSYMRCRLVYFAVKKMTAQQHPEAWVLPLMLNPLSALRVTMLFTLERTAPASIGTGALIGW